MAKKEIKIIENQNIIEIKKKLSLKKLKFFFIIVKLNKKNKAQKVTEISGKAGPVINRTGINKKINKKKLLVIFIDL